MALDDFQGEPVLNGTWLYDGSVPTRTQIVAYNFDLEHAYALEELDHVVEDHGGEPYDVGQPRPMGPDGVLYRAQNGPLFDTIEEAKAWAGQQPWGPITWDR
jgi:hypothetical protein